MTAEDTHHPRPRGLRLNDPAFPPSSSESYPSVPRTLLRPSFQPSVFECPSCFRRTGPQPLAVACTSPHTVEPAGPRDRLVKPSWVVPGEMRPKYRT